MHKTARAMMLAVLTFLVSVALVVGSAMMAAVTLAATALIVPGTGTPNANIVTNYLEQARDRYLTTTPCVGAGCTLTGINYPASFWPLGFPPFPSSWCPGLSCATWNDSVGEGVSTLNSELLNVLSNDPDEQIVMFGYSQGGGVVSTELANLKDLDPDLKDNITVVTIGNILNPQGLWTRLSFLPTIPILNVTFNPTLPTDIGIKSTNYAFEYDPVGDAPLYLFNPLALLNAVAALEYVHGDYLDPNGNDLTGTLPYGYDDMTLAAAISDPDNIRTYQDGTFVLIPQQGTLPIMQPIVDFASSTGTTPFVQPFVDLLSPIFKVLIDTGYDRTANPGIPQTFQLFPILNPVTLTVDLITAGIQGVQDFVNDLSGITLTPPAPLAPPAPPAPLAPTGPSTLALRQSETTTLQPQLSLNMASRDHSSVTNPAKVDALKTDALKTDSPVDSDLGKTTSTENELSTSTQQTSKHRPSLASDSTQPKIKSGNMFRPGHTTPVTSNSGSTDLPATGTVDGDNATTDDAAATETGAKTPAKTPATGGLSTGAAASTGSSQAAA